MIPVNPEFVLSLGIAAFLAIVFLQSGLDKLFDFSGNVAYLTELFASGALASVFTGITALASCGELISCM